jgi:hypothetical protein
MKSDAALADLGEQIRAMSGRMTELVALARGNQLNNVLYAGTIQIPAAIAGGPACETWDFKVPIAAVMVDATEAAAPVTAVAGPPASQIPPSGAGVLRCTGGLSKVVPMAGTMLTIYGTPGDFVFIGVWTRPQPPTAS